MKVPHCIIKSSTIVFRRFSHSANQQNREIVCLFRSLISTLICSLQNIEVETLLSLMKSNGKINKSKLIKAQMLRRNNFHFHQMSPKNWKFSTFPCERRMVVADCNKIPYLSLKIRTNSWRVKSVNAELSPKV